MTERDDGPLLNLPNEMLSVIFSLLSLSDVHTVRTLCQRACHLIDDDAKVLAWQRARWNYFRRRLEKTKGVPQMFNLQRPAMMRVESLRLTWKESNKQIIDVIDRICQELNLGFAIDFNKDADAFASISHLSGVKKVYFEGRQWGNDCFHRDSENYL